MIGASVRVDGADRALKALAILEPTVARETKQQISKIGKMLADHITDIASDHGDPPVSGWRQTPTWPGWSPVRGQSRRVGAGVAVTSTSSDVRIAAMYEYIGNATKITDPVKGQRLSNLFNERLGATVSAPRRQRPGRLIRRTINERYGEAREQLEAAVNRAVNEVNRRMP
jgi:hypothetical protein